MVSSILFLGVALVMEIQVRAHPPPDIFMTSDIVRGCITSSGVGPEELLKGYEANPSEERLCFYKCILNESGILTDDGEIVVEESHAMPFPGKFSEDMKKEFLECASNIGPIKTCEDMSKVMACAPKE